MSDYQQLSCPALFPCFMSVKSGAMTRDACHAPSMAQHRPGTGLAATSFEAAHRPKKSQMTELVVDHSRPKYPTIYLSMAL